MFWQEREMTGKGGDCTDVAPELGRKVPGFEACERGDLRHSNGTNTLRGQLQRTPALSIDAAVGSINNAYLFASMLGH